MLYLTYLNENSNQNKMEYNFTAKCLKWILFFYILCGYAMFPFKLSQQCSWYILSLVSLQWSWYMMPPSSLQCSWCMTCASLWLWFWKLSSDCPPLHIPLPFALFLNSHVFYCFIHFDFLHILANNEKELLVVSHVFFNPQHCSSILSCFTYQKSINFLHKSVKQCVSRLSHKYTSINLCKNTRQCCRTNKVTLVSIGDVGYARTRYHTNKVTLVSMVDGG